MKFIDETYAYLLKLRHSAELRKSLIYLSTTSFAFGIVFIQNFSIAYFSSVDFFGKVTLLIALFSTLYVIFTCGLNAVILRFFFDKKYSENQNGLISHVTCLWLVFGLILVVLLLSGGYLALAWKQFLPLNYYSEFIPIVFGSFFYSSTEIFSNIFIAQEKPLKYAFLLISSRLTIFLMLHGSVFFLGESSSHIALTLLLSGLIMCVYTMIVVKAFPLFPVYKTNVKQLFTYAFPLMIYALGGIGYSHGYRVMISTWLSYEDLALFTLANQIALVYYLTAASSVTAFYPRAYKALESQNGNPRAIRFYLKLLLAIGIGVGIIIIPGSYVFLQYFKEGAFYASTEILPFLLIGQFFFFLYSYNYVLCTFYKETKILTYAMAAGVSTSLILASILIEKGSLWSAAIPVMCGLFVQFMTSLFLVQRAVKIRKSLSTL